MSGLPFPSRCLRRLLEPLVSGVSGPWMGHLHGGLGQSSWSLQGWISVQLHMPHSWA